VKSILYAAAIIVAATPALAQSDFSKVEIKTTQVAEGVYMLAGAGGNIGLSVGEDGAFLIDDQFAPLNEKILAAIAAVTDKPVEFVLNTHYHGDHTGGNEPLGKSGAHIVAHDNVRARLEKAKAGTPAAALPVITFSDTTTFHWNGQEIYVFHPKNAHTDGDAIVYFRHRGVVHMGDAMFSGRYPYIDIDAGGSLEGYIASLQSVAAMVDDDVTIIPGHGPLSSKADIERSIAMLKGVRTRVQALIDQGLDEEAAVAADPLADLNEEWAWQFITGEKMVRTAYKSLTAK
jgi:cyclase